MRLRGCLVLIGFFSVFSVFKAIDDAGLPWQIALIAVIALFIWAARVQDRARCSSSAVTSLSNNNPELKKPKSRERSISITQHTSSDIETALERLPTYILQRSGSVFYTGKDAFLGQNPLYILGLNPGGNPDIQRTNTVAGHIDDFRNRSAPWSAYADDSWEGMTPGTCGMQPRVLHMLKRLDLDPRKVPASNVVFVRSRNEAELDAEKSILLRDCWPVHGSVISKLGIRVVLCFGGTAGRWVRGQVGATQLVDEFRETNARGWKSEAHSSPNGLIVITATHPSRADWRNPAADPTPLVKRMLR